MISENFWSLPCLFSKNVSHFCWLLSSFHNFGWSDDYMIWWKKCLFLIIWCPTWSKHLGRFLICLSDLSSQHTHSAWGCCQCPKLYIPSSTAKRILERLSIQTSSLLSKFDRSVFLNLKPISYFLAFIWLGFLSRNFWS